MPSEPRWVSPGAVVEINKAITSTAGEPFLVLDYGLLEGALGVPENMFHYAEQDDVGVLAAAMLIAIARNHPFEQGNKRTAVEAAGYFLALNGYDWDAPDVDDGGPDDFAEHLLAVLEHKMTVGEFTGQFIKYLRLA